jgi:glycosyltransferase involved in cell wall biosynthesis
VVELTYQGDALVSVVIPAYNAEKFIKDTINSVYMQSYQPMEVIVVNDGSKESTLEVAERMLASSPKGMELKVVNKEKNEGAAKALNTGFSLAKGDYICWLSADDMFIDREKTRNQLEEMEKTGALLSYFRDYYAGPTPAEAHLIRTCYLNLRKTRVLDGFFNSQPSMKAMMLVFMNPINGSSVMMKRDCVQDFGNFDQVLMNVDADGDLWMRYSHLGLKFLALGGAPLFYRLHAEQTSQNLSKMIYGIDLTRMRTLSFLSEIEKLEGLIKKFWPFLIPISMRKSHLHCPLSSRLISEYVLSRSERFNPLITRYVRSIQRDVCQYLRNAVIDEESFLDLDRSPGAKSSSISKTL